MVNDPSREAPNPKHQAPEKLQTSSSNRDARLLELGAWCFSGAWSLGFGASAILPPISWNHTQQPRGDFSRRSGEWKHQAPGKLQTPAPKDAQCPSWFGA